MTRALAWTERGLLATAAFLAIWCTIQIAEAYYIRTLPVPPPTPAVPAGGPAGAIAPPAEAPPAAGSWLARLEAPGIGLSTTVLEGSDGGTLARAAGHVEGTALPGASGNIGIAGHRDTVFQPLRNIQVGNTLALTTADTQYWYRVVSTRIVDPEDVGVLDPGDRPELTLVTCYPFVYVGHAPRRFIVRAELIGANRR